MNGPAIFVLRDGTVPNFIVAIADPAETDPPVFDLYAWAFTFGHAQERVREWNTEHARARARVGTEW